MPIEKQTADSAQTPNGPRKCLKCGAELADAVLSGQCPACMVKVLRESDAAAGVSSSPPEALSHSALHTPQSALPLRYFGDYELLGELGRGGMGVVYRARQLTLQRTVALKLMAPEQLASPKAVERFHTEAGAAANLDHPHIVPIYESGECDGRHYFSMKLIEGQNLAQRMAELTLTRPSDTLSHRMGEGRGEGGRPAPSKSEISHRQSAIASLLAQVADAVHYAHQRGILHRDLKPGNILIDSAGEPHVTDFGLAKLVEGDSSLTLSGEVLGTPAYMAPEQAAGNTKQMTTAADIYSLGVILYELLTGRPPFRGETPMATLHALMHEVPSAPRSLNPAVPRDLETICLKCLEKEPARRYTSARALAEDLRRFIGGEPVQARPIGPTGKVSRWCRRKPALAATLLLLQVALVVGLAGILWQWHRAEHNAAEARAKELITRESLYAADISLAQQTLAADNFGQALDLLRRHIPNQGEPDLRGFEWRYLWRQCQSDELFSLPGHKNAAGAVAFSPDGTRLATGSEDTTVKVWDLVSRRAVATLTNHPVGIQSIAFSPSGDVLATASYDAVWLWDTKAFQPLRSLPDAYLKAKFSPDGGFLVTGARNGLILWDAHTWRALTRSELARLWVQGRPLNGLGFGLAFSPDSRRVAVASDEGIKLLRIPDLQETAMLPESLPRFRPIAFAPDGRTIAAATLKHDVKVWDVETGQVTNLLSGHSDSVFGLAFSPDGKKLATGSADQTVKLWDRESGRLVRTLKGHANEVWDVAFSSDGKLLASVGKDGAVKLWDPSTSLSDDTEMRGMFPPGSIVEDNIVIVCVPPHSATWLLATTTTNQTVSLWKVAEGVRSFVLTNATAPMAFSLDGTTLATTVAGHNKARLWRMERDGVRELSTVGSGGIQKRVDGLAVSPDGRVVATGEWDGSVGLWDAASGLKIATLVGHKRSKFSLAFSPDGHTLASRSDDLIMRLWHVPTRRELLKLSGRSEDPIVGHGEIGFSPDGRTLVAQKNKSDDALCQVWYAPSFAEIAVAEGKDSRAEMGDGPARWSATARALAKRNRDTEALEVFTRVIQLCGQQPSLATPRISALRQRGQLLKRLGRLAEAEADNRAMLNIPTRDARASAQLLDLSPRLNRPLDCESFSMLPTTTYLEGLPRGLHALPGTGAVRFDLRGVVRLSRSVGGEVDPASAEEIPVQQRCRRLHFLELAHGQEADGATVGAYVIHYADGQREEIPVRYGQHVRDWVLRVDPGETPDAKVAWTGTHPTKGAIRIFEQTWENPRPEIAIATLDFVSKLTKCAPALIAITAEP